MSQSQQIPTSPDAGIAADISWEELSNHRGRWVAFSPDGRRLIASFVTLTALEAQLRAAGEDPEEVLLERVPDGGFIGSGRELT